MEHMLKSEDFVLIIEPQIFERDINAPNNTIVGVTVQSDGFSAHTTMDIGIKGLVKFASDLSRVYETLSGEARIEEPYGMHMYLSFVGNGRGQIAVKGYLHKGGRAGNEQELRFENCIDQTCLRSFCDELNKTFKKYSQE